MKFRLLVLLAFLAIPTLVFAQKNKYIGYKYTGVTYNQTLPNGVTYDTIDLGRSPGDDYGPIRVPAGHLFLMGDNRDRSADSRFPAGMPENGLGGPVPWENIGGRAEFITFSLDGTTKLLNPVSWFEALRGGRAGSSLRPQEEPQAQE